jgi:sec-independent protein translocase protein TatA
MTHANGPRARDRPPEARTRSGTEMLNISAQELLIILVIALLVVGPQRLPALGRSIGKGLRELRKAQDEVKRTINLNLDDEPPNGGARARKPGRTSPAPGDGQPATPPPAAADDPPTAAEPLPASEVREISRSLGRSLSELRRAKEEVQRSFRVDLTPLPKPSRRPSPRQAGPEPPTALPGSGSGSGARSEPESSAGAADRASDGPPAE